MNTINIPIIIWGQNYIDNFEKYTYKNLILEVQKYKDFFKNYNINIIVCTKKESFQKFKITFNDDEINLTLINIDFLIEQYEENNLTNIYY